MSEDKLYIVNPQRLLAVKEALEFEGWKMLVRIEHNSANEDELEFTSNLLYFFREEQKTTEEYNIAFVERYKQFFG